MNSRIDVQPALPEPLTRWLADNGYVVGESSGESVWIWQGGKRARFSIAALTICDLETARECIKTALSIA
jgi:hypothetical protein